MSSWERHIGVYSNHYELLRYQKELPLNFLFNLFHSNESEPHENLIVTSPKFSSNCWTSPRRNTCLLQSVLV
ncbi:uncharacterized protein EAF01_002897 [Botrytis porri]|uniref:uncharacterized protein n=1 Tax=Botrytis porri TaxID=87229 RepID=UPI0019009C9C|nr:uncharacterized protein EAF01_002897 [Botrytis porri]KAF7911390.1 hypothetical protein EAF01_002897 [Botrytis porri]